MTLTRLSLVGAPLCLFAYGTIRLLGQHAGTYGPGLAWESGHIAAVAGFLLFGVVALAIRRRLPRHPATTAVMAVTFAGLVALLVQFGVDIVAGIGAADHAAMSATQAGFAALPGAQAAFYDVGPQLFYVGVAVLVVMAAIARQLPWWGVALVLFGFTLPVVSLNLLPIGALCLLIGLLPLHTATIATGGSRSLTAPDREPV